MPARRRYQRHSPGTRSKSAECSHTREVTETFVALFYFSSAARKKTCPRQRPQTSAAPGAGLLRAARLAPP
jgi:hypothetical protein